MGGKTEDVLEEAMEQVAALTTLYILCKFVMFATEHLAILGRWARQFFLSTFFLSCAGIIAPLLLYNEYHSSYYFRFFMIVTFITYLSLTWHATKLTMLVITPLNLILNLLPLEPSFVMKTILTAAIFLIYLEAELIKERGEEEKPPYIVLFNSCFGLPAIFIANLFVFKTMEIDDFKFFKLLAHLAQQLI